MRSIKDGDVGSGSLMMDPKEDEAGDLKYNVKTKEDFVPALSEGAQ